MMISYVSSSSNEEKQCVNVELQSLYENNYIVGTDNTSSCRVCPSCPSLVEEARNNCLARKIPLLIFHTSNNEACSMLK